METTCPNCDLEDMHNLVTRTREAWTYQCRECGTVFEVLHDEMGDR
jgi:uncharacterized Zn finger protein